MVRTPDAAAQLVQLGEAEAVGAVDQDGVRARHVDAGFDDRRAHQHVEALAVEIQHHLFEFALGIWPWAMRMRASGTSSREFARGAFDAVDCVVQKIYLPAAPEFALERLAHRGGVVWRDEGLHRKAMLRRRGDDGQVAQSCHRHVQRARDRRRGEGEQIDLGAQFLQCFLVAHAEAVFLVDDDEAEILELHVRLQQPVRADHHVDLAVAQFRQRLVGFLFRLEARDHFHAHRPVGEAVAEILVMLLGEQRRRYEHGDLLAAIAATKAARSATSVLPKPTSPQTTRSIALPEARSAITASIACNWSGVSSNGNAAANCAYSARSKTSACPWRASRCAYRASSSAAASRTFCAALRLARSQALPPSECSGAQFRRGAGIARRPDVIARPARRACRHWRIR